MNIRYSLLLLIWISWFLTLSGTAHAQPSAAGKSFTVNDTGDTFDLLPGDGVCGDAKGKCTLRAAIEEANATDALDAVLFEVAVPAVISLELGELTVTKPIVILGRGANRLTVRRSTAANTPAFRIFNLTALTQLRGMTVSNGQSPMKGGGILVAAPAQFFDLAITGNTARAGGGIAVSGGQDLFPVIERSLIAGNTATEEGGGIYVDARLYPILRSSTVTNNSSATGGGMANYGLPALTSCTIARNTAAENGVAGIYNGTGGAVDIVNTILGPDAGQFSVSGNFASYGNNLVTNTTGSSGWLSDDLVSTNNGIDPMLGPLSDNGGQTQTIPLFPGSPAINRGNRCVIEGHCIFDWEMVSGDQRKYSRADGDPDIGAFEFNAVPDKSVTTVGVVFGGNERLAYSRVIVTNTETMERRQTFVALWNEALMRSGITRPLTFEHDSVYLAEIFTKRQALQPLQIITFGDVGPR